MKCVASLCVLVLALGCSSNSGDAPRQLSAISYIKSDMRAELRLKPEDLGKSIEVQVPGGSPVSIDIPSDAASGMMVACRGAVADGQGNLYVKVVLP